MRALFLLMVFCIPTLGWASSHGTEAQMLFRPGLTARERFNPDDYRMSRRRRWALQEERRNPVANPVPMGQGTGTGAVTHPEVLKQVIHPEMEKRLRSYARRGQCPRGLPQDMTLRCRELLRAALEQRQHPPSSLLLHRSKNPRQQDRRAGRKLELSDRVQLVRPRSERLVPEQRKNPRTLDREAGRED